MEITFSGKKALVTGAGRGIGREIAKKLAQCKAKVIAVARTQSTLDSLRKEEPSIETVSLDLSNWQEARKTISELGPFDLLVNNAAYAALTPIDTPLTEEMIDKHFNLNVKATMNVTQVVAQGMIKRKSGAIVMMSSQAAKAALKDHLVYSATKAAMDSMTQTLALELGPHGIRVNSVNPTVVNTDMGKVGWSDPAVAKGMTDKIPLGRFCEPEEVANLVVYLLSDKATMVSGIHCPIDGGFLAC